MQDFEGTCDGNEAGGGADGERCRDVEIPPDSDETVLDLVGEAR